MMQSDLTPLKNMIALARRRKGNMRSKMLKVVMPLLSGEDGERLAKAVEGKDYDRAKEVWDSIKAKLGKKLGDKASAQAAADAFDMTHEELVSELEQVIIGDLTGLSSTDTSSILLGSTTVGRTVRKLVANGVTELSSSKGDVYTLQLTDMKMQRAAVGNNVKIKVNVTIFLDKTKIGVLSETDTYAAALNEIVMKAYQRINVA